MRLQPARSLIFAKPFQVSLEGLRQWQKLAQEGLHGMGEWAVIGKGVAHAWTFALVQDHSRFPQIR
jgi:hypothetical protein